MEKVKVGIIGGGLMGREVASAFGRWFVLQDFPVKPELIAVCDVNPNLFPWYQQIETVKMATTDYQELLANKDIEVVYVAVPHNWHERIYIDTVEAGKDLLAEKPFGIDSTAAKNIKAAIDRTGRFVRCSSELPFFPGAQRVIKAVQSGQLGKILEIHMGYHHSSDLNPNKPINWKRQVKYCGETGVMGDLGMHVTHIPLRMGWKPVYVYAQLQKIYTQRPDGKGGLAACDTWDNAVVHTDVEIDGQMAPMTLETKRMAPSEMNTWFLKVLGIDGGVRFSLKEPRTLWTFRRDGEQQVWQHADVGFTPVFPTITGGIFEFGFPDCFLQMLAGYFAERVGALQGRFGCVTTEEALMNHTIFEAALQSHQEKAVIKIDL
jgi:predicted dehydrogenase